MKIIYKLLFMAAAVSLFAQCDDKNETPETNDPTKILLVSGISENNNFKIELLATDSLFVGYNKLYLKITQESDGEIIEAGTLTIKPMMEMVKMSHSAPFENPAEQVNEDDYFECAVVFIMPSNADEGWTLTVNIEAQGIADQVTLALTDVTSLDEARSVRFISPEDGKTYFISLLEPADPEVGINELEFTVHHKESMMSFPADEDLTITFEPEMPSMNHGSPNNVDPVHDVLGHYLGKVNFTMTGWWRLNVRVSKHGIVIADDIDFDVTF